MEAGAATVTTPPAPPPAGTAPASAAPASAAPTPSTPATGTPPPAAGTPAPAASAPSSEPANLLATDESPVEGSAGAKGTEAPKPVDLKLPEGFKETPALTEFKALAGEAGLKSEVAQKMFDTYLKSQAEQSATQVTEWKQQQAKWAESLKTDKDFGGQAFDANLALAKRAISKFGNPELRELLNKSWLGNHPGVVRFLHAVGKSMAEDSVAGKSGAGANPPSAEDQLKALYPTHFQKKD